MMPKSPREDGSVAVRERPLAAMQRRKEQASRDKMSLQSWAG